MVDEYWLQQFRHRMEDFAAMSSSDSGRLAVSIKLRPDRGCFGRCCCPESYAAAERSHRPWHDRELVLEEHETGPEILSFVGAGMSLAAGVISLMVVMLDARARGKRRGEPVKVIIRTIRKDGSYQEEEIMEVNCIDPITEIEIEETVRPALMRLTVGNQTEQRTNN